MEITVNKEMWEEWRKSPVTNLVFKAIRERREFIKEQLARDYYGPQVDRAIGMCSALNEILDIDFEDYEGENS